MPLSPRMIWEVMKRMNNKADPTRRPMILAELHGYVVPPHWRASRRHMTPGIRMAVPMRSSFWIRARMDRFSGLLARCILR